MDQTAGDEGIWREKFLWAAIGISLVAHLLWALVWQQDDVVEFSLTSSQQQVVSVSFSQARPPQAVRPIDREHPPVVEEEAQPIIKHELQPIVNRQPEPVVKKESQPVIHKAPQPVEPPTVRREEQQKPTPIDEPKPVTMQEPEVTPRIAEPAAIRVVRQPSFRAAPVAPVYPMLALKRRWQGEVLIRALVDRAGQTLEVHVRRSSGYPLLDESAVAAVSKWQFEASAEDGEPVISWVEVPVNFSISQR